jgi:hypothetical protein
MRKPSIPAVLRQILRSAIVTPAVLGPTACGGAVDGSSPRASMHGDGGGSLLEASVPGDGGDDESSPQASMHGDGGGSSPEASVPRDGGDGCSTPMPTAATLAAASSDAGPPCFTYTLPLSGYSFDCGVQQPYCHGVGSGTPPAICAALCHHDGAVCWSATYNAVSCGLGQCYSGGGVCCGRRPAGLILDAAGGRSAIGRWFAELAAREAASVEAFDILRVELIAHGAPTHLVAAAQRAARDEVRHARVMTALAARHGGHPRAPRVARSAIRPLEAIAIENAAEGCVRETFGALVGMWQARFANDSIVRKAMVRIARDESRHAALSWQVAGWIDGRLSPSARRRVTKACAAAIAQLEVDISREPAPAIVREVGVPSGPAARMLLTRMRDALWS